MHTVIAMIWATNDTRSSFWMWDGWLKTNTWWLMITRGEWMIWKKGCLNVIIKMRDARWMLIPTDSNQILLSSSFASGMKRLTRRMRNKINLWASSKRLILMISGLRLTLKSYWLPSSLKLKVMFDYIYYYTPSLSTDWLWIHLSNYFSKEITSPLFLKNASIPGLSLYPEWWSFFFLLKLPELVLLPIRSCPNSNDRLTVSCSLASSFNFSYSLSFCLR